MSINNDIWIYIIIGPSGTSLPYYTASDDAGPVIPGLRHVSLARNADITRGYYTEFSVRGCSPSFEDVYAIRHLDRPARALDSGAHTNVIWRCSSHRRGVK